MLSIDMSVDQDLRCAARIPLDDDNVRGGD
jgi:hypothetical protein